MKLKIILLIITGFIILGLLGLGLLGYFAENKKFTAEDLQKMSLEQRSKVLRKAEKVSQIEITESGFAPNLVEIKQGKSLCWLNNSDKEYILVFPNFESPLLQAGSWCRVFLEIGEIDYFLKNNSDIKGKIIIK